MNKIKLICLGDILPADRQHTDSLGTGSTFKNEKGKNWLSAINKFTRDKDILFGNLEAPLIEEETYRFKKEFAGDIAFADWLETAGFDVVAVANNHILEHGKFGFDKTLDVLKNANVKSIGEKDERNGSNLVCIQKKNICVGFASFNAIHDITPNHSYAELNECSVNKAISGLKNMGADIVCLSFHWGNEFINIPSWEQIQLAHKAVDAGADIIIGHHPHVVQPIEEYKQGVILYSLGNFIFDMLWSKQVRSGLSVEIVLNKQGIINYKANLVNIQKNYTPEIIGDDEWLNHLLDNNQIKMCKLLEQGKEAYEKYYYRKLKINRFKARIGMKKQLISQWYLLDNSVKKEIFKNIYSKVFS